MIQLCCTNEIIFTQSANRMCRISDSGSVIPNCNVRVVVFSVRDPSDGIYKG